MDIKLKFRFKAIRNFRSNILELLDNDYRPLITIPTPQLARKN